MGAKMQMNTAIASPNAVYTDAAVAGSADPSVHVAHLVSVLAALQADAQNLHNHLRAVPTAAQTASDAADLRLVMQQTLEQLSIIQDGIATQQARFDALLEEADADIDAGTSNKTIGARARLADSLRDSQSEAQVARGGRAATRLYAGPAAASGLGDGGLGQEMPNVMQVPGGEREGLDGIVTLVGGMMRAAAAPVVVGRQQKLAGWQTRPESASLEELQEHWGQYVTKQLQTRQAPESMDINQLIQWVMREAYVGNTQDLRAHATRVEYYTQLKTQLRQELDRARTFRSEHRTGVGEQAKLDAPFDKRHISLEPNVSSEGHWTTRPSQPDGTTDRLEDLDGYIKKLDNALSTVGDDGQAAQLDLQNLSQKQAQLLNMLSNLSKALHDTAMSIIRKIGN